MAELIGGATATLTIGGVDLSDHISSATLEKNADEVETTAFGDASRTLIGGLQSGVLTINFHQDYAASEVDATISPLVGSLTAFVFKPTNAVVGSTNPSESGSVFVNSYTPISAEAGTLSTFSVSWPTSGTITRATS